MLPVGSPESCLVGLRPFCGAEGNTAIAALPDSKLGLEREFREFRGREDPARALVAHERAIGHLPLGPAIRLPAERRGTVEEEQPAVGDFLFR
jgi:hypothetical protein